MIKHGRQGTQNAGRTWYPAKHMDKSQWFLKLKITRISEKCSKENTGNARGGPGSPPGTITKLSCKQAKEYNNSTSPYTPESSDHKNHTEASIQMLVAVLLTAAKWKPKCLSGEFSSSTFLQYNSSSQPVDCDHAPLVAKYRICKSDIYLGLVTAKLVMKKQQNTLWLGVTV